MRRFIVDTDTASDDAAALMIAALSEEIDLLGVTIVAGNVGLKQATDNALMTLEVCGSDAPVYLGAKRPLFRERHETISVHGKDGMGDCDIIHPKRSPEEKRAVEFILEQVERYPNEVELVVLGPATNIALAILTDREIMSKVKHIWSMGTPGFGFGNATPVSEFNVSTTRLITRKLLCNSFVFRVLLLNGLLEYCVFRQKERQKGLQRPRWRLKCFYSDLRILSNGSQAILWHPAMSFAFLEDKQDKSIPTLDIRVLLLIGSG